VSDDCLDDFVVRDGFLPFIHQILLKNIWDVREDRLCGLLGQDLDADYHTLPLKKTVSPIPRGSEHSDKILKHLKTGTATLFRVELHPVGIAIYDC